MKKIKVTKAADRNAIEQAELQESAMRRARNKYVDTEGNVLWMHDERLTDAQLLKKGFRLLTAAEYKEHFCEGIEDIKKAGRVASVLLGLLDEKFAGFCMSEEIGDLQEKFFAMGEQLQQQIAKDIAIDRAIEAATVRYLARWHAAHKTKKAA